MVKYYAKIYLLSHIVLKQGVGNPMTHKQNLAPDLISSSWKPQELVHLPTLPGLECDCQITLLQGNPLALMPSLPMGLECGMQS